jgi:hypothetical protein
MGKWTADRFPCFEPAIRRLAEQHRELRDEPLHLAVSYGPKRDPQDIFLFEVVAGAGEPPAPRSRLHHEPHDARFIFPCSWAIRMFSSIIRWKSYSGSCFHFSSWPYSQ